MKLKATKGFCIGAGKDVASGDVFEATERDAAIHIQKGRAVKADDKDIMAASSKAKAKAKAEAEDKQKGGE